MITDLNQYIYWAATIVKEFLNKFLSVQLPAARWSKLPGFRVVAEFRLESQMYNTFVCSLKCLLSSWVCISDHSMSGLRL